MSILYTIIIIILVIVAIIKKAIEKSDDDEYIDGYEPDNKKRFYDFVGSYDPKKIDNNAGLNNDGFKNMVLQEPADGSYNFSYQGNSKKSKMLDNPLGSWTGAKNMESPKIVKRTYELDVEPTKRLDKVFDEFEDMLSRKSEETVVKPTPPVVEKITEKIVVEIPNEQIIIPDIIESPTEMPKVGIESVPKLVEAETATDTGKMKPEIEIEAPPEPEPVKKISGIKLDEMILLKVIQKFGREEIFISYGFFDNKYIMPEEISNTFIESDGDIIKSAKLLKRNGLLTDKQDGEIFGYPFIKKIIISRLGEEKLAV
jgi:hypothetical protein